MLPAPAVAVVAGRVGGVERVDIGWEGPRRRVRMRAVGVREWGRDWLDCRAYSMAIGWVHACYRTRSEPPCLASLGLGWVCVVAVHHSLFRDEPPSTGN